MIGDQLKANAHLEWVKLLSETTLTRLIGTLVLAAIILILRFAVVRAIRHDQAVLSDEQRRWISRTRNISVIALLLGLVLIWATAIHNLALSLTAVAVAVVVATKELILCFTGAILRTSSAGFEVGDWIEIAGIRGEVIDQTFLTTTVQEIDSSGNSYRFTGKSIVIPNSLLFSHSVTKENFRKRYVFHSFSVTMDPHFDVFEEEEFLRERLRLRCSEFEEVARRYHGVIARRLGIVLPDPEPSIRVTTTELGRIVVRVTVFCPTDRAVGLEQRITKDLFALYFRRLIDNAARSPEGSAYPKGPAPA